MYYFITATRLVFVRQRRVATASGFVLAADTILLKSDHAASIYRYPTAGHNNHVNGVE